MKLQVRMIGLETIATTTIIQILNRNSNQQPSKTSFHSFIDDMSYCIILKEGNNGERQHWVRHRFAESKIECRYPWCCEWIIACVMEKHQYNKKNVDIKRCMSWSTVVPDHGAVVIWNEQLVTKKSDFLKDYRIVMILSKWSSLLLES